MSDAWRIQVGPAYLPQRLAGKDLPSVRSALCLTCPIARTPLQATDPEAEIGMTLYQRILNSPYIPWSFRHPLEVWVEGKVAQRWPGLYRWLRLCRRAVAVGPLTKGHKHHFFGYYDKSPWNKSGCYILAHEVGFNDRPPDSHDTIAVGVIDTSQGDRFEPVASSSAWN